jgi:L-proline amide hydrolase
MMAFYRRHLIRRDKMPREMMDLGMQMSKPVSWTMNGPNEFLVVGNIRYWDSTDKPHIIRVPTLVTGADTTRSRRKWPRTSTTTSGVRRR